MEKMKETLSQKEMINKEKIRDLRKWVDDHYEGETTSQKAKIIAIKIRETIEESLPNFPQELKKTIRNDLIQQKLVFHSTINANDVLQSSIKLASEGDIEKELSVWIQQEVELDVEVIKSYIHQLLDEYEQAEREVAAATVINHDVALEKKEVRATRRRPYLVDAIVVFFILSFMTVVIQQVYSKNTELAKEETIKTNESEMSVRLPNALPVFLQYQSINEEKLQSFLNEGNSLLAEDPYFTTILDVADEFNVHPLFLFAITGQEQSFVPKHHENSEKIANNPYNVFYSWQDYNTDIRDSSEIAARTVINLSEDRPKDADPIQWINRRYAEDQNWWVGVSSIFEQLREEVE